MSNNYIVINGKRADLTEEQLCKLGIKPSNYKPLKSFALGSTVNIGNREFIVLEQSGDTTAVITKQFVKSMAFGGSGNYLDSDVRRFCNGEFYRELANAIGADNILKHKVCLEADDGTGKDQKCSDKVSILTAQRYRQYRSYLPAYGQWWWTATRVTADSDCYSRRVCYVNSNGVLCCYVCDCSFGVRPFCVLNSSILVSCE